MPSRIGSRATAAEWGGKGAAEGSHGVAESRTQGAGSGLIERSMTRWTKDRLIAGPSFFQGSRRAPLPAQGCDIKASRANGDTLLHIAAGANDAAFVRYLLDQGLDASAAGEYGLPPLASVQDEDVALLLLEAGTDLRMMDDDGQRFIDYARDNHWGRVVAWLQRSEAKGR